MPDRSLTVATYAAGASLAAITLIYVFAPTYFLDSDQSSGVFGSRKRGIVGLSNPANDCFINSVLQALAGLNDLRLYLIQETHRRSLDDGRVYAHAVPPVTKPDGEGGSFHTRKDMPEWKTEGLQMGLVTKGLKDMLDALNERPIYRKTISAGPFVRTLEMAFRQRISRQQQDAQEFLQVVAERLCEEYHAGHRARTFARTGGLPAGSTTRTFFAPIEAESQQKESAVGDSRSTADLATLRGTTEVPGPIGHMPVGNVKDEGEESFPLEGKFESQIECLTCGFKPRPTESTFCTLTLNVPQTSVTTINACFDGMFKTEYIDDFKCEKCRLLHALELLQAEYLDSRPEGRAALAKLQLAIDTDPEKLPEDVKLPDLRHAPKRKIARHIRLTRFPRILAIHLSRSIYDASNLSQKNSAKVSFPEQLPLGGLLSQKKYRLRGLVTHKGSHHSGHYETFRRQDTPPPFSNPSTFQPSVIYSVPSSTLATPQVGALEHKSEESSPLASVPDLLAPGPGADSSTLSLDRFAHERAGVPSSSSELVSPRSGLKNVRPARSHELDETTSIDSVAVSARSTFSVVAPGSSHTGGHDIRRGQRGKAGVATENKRRKHPDRWWRISDEKVKLASTNDVLSMQREVYLLFYELDRECR